MRINLRYLENKDIDNLLEIENDQRYWYLSSTTKPFTKQELYSYIQNAKDPIEKYGQLRFVIEVNNKFSGLIDLYEYDSIKAGVGIILLDEYHKKGIASKALQKLKDYCVLELKLKELFARIEVDNINSISLFVKSNFKKEKLLKNYLIRGNIHIDCKEYYLHL